MIPLSGGVLGAAAVVSSPALWLSLVEGTMPLDVALTRYLIAVAVCWVALSFVVDLAFSPRSPVPVRSEEPAEADTTPRPPDR